MTFAARPGARGRIVQNVVQNALQIVVQSVALSIALANVCAISKAAEIDEPAAVPDFQVKRMPFGSGTPAANVTDGTETALPVADGLYHVPNYLPGFPTAATIWPRELPLDCVRDIDSGKPTCTGFEVYPATGRGEYLFVRPMLKPLPVVAAPTRSDPPPAVLPMTHKKPLG